LLVFSRAVATLRSLHDGSGLTRAGCVSVSDLLDPKVGFNRCARLAPPLPSFHKSDRGPIRSPRVTDLRILLSVCTWRGRCRPAGSSQTLRASPSTVAVISGRRMKNSGIGRSAPVHKHDILKFVDQVFI